MLNRQPTKNIFTPNAFRKLSRCIICGYSYKRKDKICRTCRGKYYKKCISCDCYLKKENYFTYTYDSNKYNRNYEVKFYISKSKIKEFVTENLPNCTIKEDTCDYCVNLLNRDLMRDRCFLCRLQFINWFPHYKKYGNCCESCDKKCELESEKNIINITNKKNG